MEAEAQETPPLTVQVVSGRAEDLRVELVAALFFEDERPLRGPAGRIDWRLCGLASRCIARGLLGGRPGEALLVPTGGGVAARRTLLLGLGPRPGFGADALADASAEAVRRGLALGVPELALLLPPEPRCGVTAARAAMAAVAGGAEGLARAERPLRLLLWCGEDDAQATWRGAADAVRSRALAVEARLLRAALPPESAQPSARATSSVPPRPPAAAPSGP